MTKRRRIPVSAVLVAVGGVLLTSALAAAAATAHDETETRLLQEHARAGALVLELAVDSLQAPLTQAAATIDPDDPAGFVAAYDESGADQFDSVSVWVGDGLAPAAVAGEEPALAAADPAAIHRTLDAARATPGILHVSGAAPGVDAHLGYAIAVPGTDARPDVVLYAEDALERDRVVPDLNPGDAFSNLDFALYLGPVDRDHLLIANTDQLPLTGRVAIEDVAFGATTVTLAMAPRGVLGSSLLDALPRYIVATGIALFAVVAILIAGIHRRRHDAETLARDNERLYEIQHDIAHALQMSLLPDALPARPDVTFAARYVPGGVGAEVGGDWYDAVDLGDRVALVIGDAVGHDIDAATVMAGFRYSAHAYLAHGLAPDDVLNAINDQDRVRSDFVTMTCAHLDLAERTLTVANAGHPRPLLLTASGAQFLQPRSGPPVGPFAGLRYHATTFDLPETGTLVLYTDGLFERRGEDVDVSLERLRATAEALDAHHATPCPDALLERLYARLVGDTNRDDVAMLAAHWDLRDTDRAATT